MSEEMRLHAADEDLIFIKDVQQIFENKISYEGVLKLIWAKELPASKLRGKWTLSKRVVKAYKAKIFGLKKFGITDS